MREKEEKGRGKGKERGEERMKRGEGRTRGGTARDGGRKMKGERVIYMYNDEGRQGETS